MLECLRLQHRSEDTQSYKIDRGKYRRRAEPQQVDDRIVYW